MRVLRTARYCCSPPERNPACRCCFFLREGERLRRWLRVLLRRVRFVLCPLRERFSLTVSSGKSPLFSGM